MAHSSPFSVGSGPLSTHFDSFQPIGTPRSGENPPGPLSFRNYRQRTVRKFSFFFRSPTNVGAGAARGKTGRLMTGRCAPTGGWMASHFPALTRSVSEACRIQARRASECRIETRSVSECRIEARRASECRIETRSVSEAQAIPIGRGGWLPPPRTDATHVVVRASHNHRIFKEPVTVSPTLFVVTVQSYSQQARTNTSSL